MLLVVGEERIELLAYDCPASHGGPRMCGYEVYGRRRKGRPFHEQLAAGEGTEPRRSDGRRAHCGRAA